MIVALVNKYFLAQNRFQFETFEEKMEKINAAEVSNLFLK